MIDIYTKCVLTLIAVALVGGRSGAHDPNMQGKRDVPSSKCKENAMLAVNRPNVD